MTNKKDLLLSTSKKMNYAYSKGNYKTAYALLKIGNGLRKELGEKELRLPYLEGRFKKELSCTNKLN